MDKIVCKGLDSSESKASQSLPESKIVQSLAKLLHETALSRQLGIEADSTVRVLCFLHEQVKGTDRVSAQKRT